MLCAVSVSASAELYVGQPPFYTNSIYSLIQLIVKENVKFPEDISPHFKSFLKGLLNKKPSERLSWPALLDHPFVSEGAPAASPGSAGVAASAAALQCALC